VRRSALGRLAFGRPLLKAVVARQVEDLIAEYSLIKSCARARITRQERAPDPFTRIRKLVAWIAIAGLQHGEDGALGRREDLAEDVEIARPSRFQAEGERVANFLTSMLSAGDTHSEIIGIPTSERCVIGIGPLRTQRGDPFGLIRREVTWTDRIELFVHPSTVPLAGLGAGLLRDLEGQTSNEVSMSDLAFHALREYVPGDDMRYVHWRSSARRSTTSGQNQFLVRQFLDTRRSHVVVATDVTESSYADADEFETAISCGASIAVRAIQDEMDLTVVCGDHAATRPVPYQALDTFSRATWSDRSLSDVIQHLPTLAPDMSVVVMVA